MVKAGWIKKEKQGLDWFKGTKAGEFQGPYAVSRQSQCRLQTSDSRIPRARRVAWKPQMFSESSEHNAQIEPGERKVKVHCEKEKKKQE